MMINVEVLTFTTKDFSLNFFLIWSFFQFFFVIFPVSVIIGRLNLLYISKLAGTCRKSELKTRTYLSLTQWPFQWLCFYWLYCKEWPCLSTILNGTSRARKGPYGWGGKWMSLPWGHMVINWVWWGWTEKHLALGPNSQTSSLTFSILALLLFH